MTGIYKITNNLNGKSYIGLSNDIDRRWMEHRTPGNISSKTTTLAKAFRKYGIENFTFQVIEECPIEALAEREQYWISTLCPEYNMNQGGVGNLGYHIPDPIKKVLSEKGKQQWERRSEEEKRYFIKHNLTEAGKPHKLNDAMKEHLRKINLGKKASMETRMRQSLALKGKPHNDNRNDKPVIGVNESSVILFSSVKRAGEYFGIHPSCITGVLKGKRKHSCGYSWYYWSVETNGDECSRVGGILSPIQVRGNRPAVEEIVRSMEMVKSIVNTNGKGLLQLAIRSGQFKVINVTDVREGEVKGFDLLTGEIKVEGLPNRTELPIVGYAAFFRLVNGFEKTLYMTTSELEAHAARYSQTFKADKKYGSNSSKWSDDFDAMAKKTVLKLLLAKYAPKSVEMQMVNKAINDDQVVVNENNVEQYLDNPGVEEQVTVEEQTAEVKSKAMEAAEQVKAMAARRTRTAPKVNLEAEAANPVEDMPNEMFKQQ